MRVVNSITSRIAAVPADALVAAQIAVKMNIVCIRQKVTATTGKDVVYLAESGDIQRRSGEPRLIVPRHEICGELAGSSVLVHRRRGALGGRPVAAGSGGFRDQRLIGPYLLDQDLSRQGLHVTVVAYDGETSCRPGLAP